MATVGVRAFATWLVLLAIAFVNGSFREIALIPPLGETWGRAVSSLILSGTIAAVAYITIRWIAPRRLLDAALVGVLWLALTLAFEFGLGRAGGLSWTEMLEDYDIANGRIWVLVLLVTAVAPVWAARVRADHSKASRR